MAQLNIKMADERLAALRRYAHQRRTPISWLIKDYVDYLLAGGSPITSPARDDVSAMQLAGIAQQSGAFDWLAEEPDLYSADDGEAV